MSIAVIGTGRTGQYVIEALGGHCGQCFNQSNPVTVMALQKHEGVIVFVPGHAVEQLMPIVLNSGIPAVWGSTGYQWPSDLHKQLQSRNSRWIIADNFCLSMTLIKQMLAILGQLPQYYDNTDWSIQETHHQSKLDAPSGTAQRWQEWLGHDVHIESHRDSDVCGTHELIIRLPYETIKLTHQAHSRAVFAEGAVWAMGQLLGCDQSGLLSLSSLREA